MDWKLYALGSAFFAGLTAIFGKLGVQTLPSNFATFVRTLIVLAIIFLLVTWRGEWEWRSLTAKTFAFLFLSALCTGFSWLCYYHALQLGPASRVAPIDKLSVVFAMALAFLFLGEKADARTLLGGALITIGSLVIALR